jgi:hypothetical protein
VTDEGATIHTQVRTHFAQVASNLDPSSRSADDEPWGTKHYERLDDDLPAEAVLASVGCGNPTAVARRTSSSSKATSKTSGSSPHHPLPFGIVLPLVQPLAGVTERRFEVVEAGDR